MSTGGGPSAGGGRTGAGGVSTTGGRISTGGSFGAGGSLGGVGSGGASGVDGADAGSAPGGYWTMSVPAEIQLIPGSGKFTATDYCTAFDVLSATSQIENGVFFLTGPRPTGSVNLTGAPGITGFPTGDTVVTLPLRVLVASVESLVPGGRYCDSPHSVTFSYADNTTASASVTVPHDSDCHDNTGTNATTTCLGAIRTVCQPYWYENSFLNPFPSLVVSSILYSYSECYNGNYDSNGDVWAVTVRVVN